MCEATKGFIQSDTRKISRVIYVGVLRSTRFILFDRWQVRAQLGHTSSARSPIGRVANCHKNSRTRSTTRERSTG